jgi:hypothetical protein
VTLRLVEDEKSSEVSGHVRTVRTDDRTLAIWSPRAPHPTAVWRWSNVSAESSSGVIAFPETSSNKAVLCVEQLADTLTRGGFHATTLSLAGERPGEPVSGELTLSVCVN